MPDDLADAVFLLEGEAREDALDNWEAFSDDEQEAFRRYLDRARLKRTRPDRCRLAAQQLIRPEALYSFPMSPGF